jgi:hypothetical protein
METEMKKPAKQNDEVYAVDSSADQYGLLCYLERLEGFHGNEALKISCQKIR